jgi:hypothetical protein
MRMGGGREELLRESSFDARELMIAPASAVEKKKAFPRTAGTLFKDAFR